MPVPSFPPLVLHPLELTRVVASASVLDTSLAPNSMRLSTDEALCFGSVEDLSAKLPAEAIVEPETGMSGAWFAESQLRRRVACCTEWQIPPRPEGAGHSVVAQGMIAGIPSKVWLLAGDGEALLLVATSHAHEMEARF